MSIPSLDKFESIYITYNVLFSASFGPNGSFSSHPLSTILAEPLGVERQFKEVNLSTDHGKGGQKCIEVKCGQVKIPGDAEF